MNTTRFRGAPTLAPPLAFRMVGGGLKLVALVLGLGLSVVCLMSVAAIFTPSLWGQMIPALIVAAGIPLVVVERLVHAPDGARPDGLATDILATLWLGFPLLFVAGLAHVTQPLLMQEVHLLHEAGETRAARALAWLARVEPRTEPTPAPTASRPPRAEPAEPAEPPPGEAPETAPDRPPPEEPPTTPEQDEPPEELSLAALHQRIAPSLVTLSWSEGGRILSATGVVLDTEGTVATAAAVVSRTRRLRARLADGTVEEMTLAAVDPQGGVALLRPPRVLHVIPLPLAAEDPLATEETVYLYGNPVGLEPTLAQGRVVSHERSWRGRPRLQLSAAVSPANFGGPVVNSRGEVLAVALPAADHVPGGLEQTLNIAAPASQLQALLDGGSELSPPPTQSGPRPNSW